VPASLWRAERVRRETPARECERDVPKLTRHEQRSKTPSAYIRALPGQHHQSALGTSPLHLLTRRLAGNALQMICTSAPPLGVVQPLRPRHLCAGGRLTAPGRVIRRGARVPSAPQHKHQCPARGIVLPAACPHQDAAPGSPEPPQQLGSRIVEAGRRLLGVNALAAFTVRAPGRVRWRGRWLVCVGTVDRRAVGRRAGQPRACGSPRTASTPCARPPHTTDSAAAPCRTPFPIHAGAGGAGALARDKPRCAPAHPAHSHGGGQRCCRCCCCCCCWPQRHRGCSR
jgi:hypothetical protein